MGLFEWLFRTEKNKNFNRDLSELSKQKQREENLRLLGRNPDGTLMEDSSVDKLNKLSSNTIVESFPKIEMDTPTIPFDSYFSAELENIAEGVNMFFSMDQQKKSLNLMLQMISLVHGGKGHKLLQIEDEHAQVIGLAFSRMALEFNNGDPDINDIAAENAFYCLSRSFLKSKNTYVLPAIFTMFDRNSNMFKDMIDKIMMHLIIRDRDLCCKKMLAVINNYEDFKFAIMKYCLHHIYDEDKHTYKIPTDLPYYIPNEVTINKFKNAFSKLNLYNNPEKITIGYNALVLGYNRCVNTLSHF